MSDAKLVLSLPHGIIIATSLDVPALAAHLSPGSGKHFTGRTILVELAVKDAKPAFDFLDEGGWRDAAGDATMAMQVAAKEGKRTKTALSNNAFSATPISAWTHLHLAKTGGELLEMVDGTDLAKFGDASCDEHMKPDDIAKAIGAMPPPRRTPRLYMTLGPIEFLLLSNLTPVEYAWYATHRPGKRFRAVAFTEVRENPGLLLAAQSLFATAKRELQENTSKKTKTVVLGDCFNRVPFPSWVGYDREAHGGVYVADASTVRLWSFPERIPRAWERAY